MKQEILSVTCLRALAFGLVSCEQKHPSVAEPPKEAICPAPNSAKSVTTAAVDAAKAAGEKTLQTAATTANAKAQELIDAAQRLVSAGQFPDALAKLKETGNAQLSPDQQVMVDNLKAQIQTALNATGKSATDVAGAAGILLASRTITLPDSLNATLAP